MTDKELRLTDSFVKTAFDESINTIVSIGEIAFDAILKDGVFKDIPFLSTVVSCVEFASSIKKMHEIKKLNEFLLSIQQENIDETKRQKRKEKFVSNKKDREKELEYLLFILDRYIEYEKPTLLARLYLAFIDEKINWEEFTSYATILDRLLMSDIKIIHKKSNSFSYHWSDDKSVILRLGSLGIMQEETLNKGYTHAELNSGKTSTEYTINFYGLEFFSILLADNDKPQFVKEYENFKAHKDKKE